MLTLLIIFITYIIFLIYLVAGNLYILTSFIQFLLLPPLAAGDLESDLSVSLLLNLQHCVSSWYTQSDSIFLYISEWSL